MNKKLIAAAVSAAVAPVAAYGEATVYGRINNAIDVNDVADGGDSTTDLSGVASRFGVRYNSDIGNGMTAHGRYEFSTTTDREGGGIDDTRIATVGLSGPFGRIDAGNQWSAYFNTFGTLISPTYSLGYFIYNSVGAGPYRASNTIKYSNNFGPVHAELDIRLNDEASPEGADVAENDLRGDGIGLGLVWAITDNFTIAAAYDSEDREDERLGQATVEFANDTVDGTAGNGILFTGDANDDIEVTGDFGQDQDRFGIAVRGTFGGYWVNLGWQNHEADDIDVVYRGLDIDDDGDADNGTLEIEGLETDTYFIYGGGSFGEKTSWMLGYAEADDGASADEIIIRNGTISTDTDDSQQFVWALYHNLGGGLRLYYEAVNQDSENNNRDGSRHLIGMRVDF